MDDIIGMIMLGNAMDDVIGLLLWATILGFYLLPTLVAWLHEHHQLYAIAVLNLLLGWTLLGWIGALVLAFTAKEPLPNRKKLAGQKHHRKSTARTQPRHPVAHSDLTRRLAELKPPHWMGGGETSVQ